MIPAQELADMQTEAAKALPNTATLQRDQNRGQPVHGITASNWQPTYSNIAAGYRPPTGSAEQNLAAQLGLLQAWTIFLPANDANGVPVDVRVGDRCIIAGMTLTVQAPINQSIPVLTAFMASEERTK